MFCGECGTQNPDTNQFCKNCGKPLRKTPAPAAPAASPARVIMPAAPVVPSPAPVPVRSGGRNWAGIASLLCGILSWIILTWFLAAGAILLGVAGLYIRKKADAKIAFSAIIGITLAIAAMAVSVLFA